MPEVAGAQCSIRKHSCHQLYRTKQRPQLSGLTDSVFPCVTTSVIAIITTRMITTISSITIVIATIVGLVV